MDGINTNTYVSLGLVGAVVGAALWINITVMSLKTDLGGRLNIIEQRVVAVEINKGAWTQTDMYRWSVRLQRENTPIKTDGLKVPEPERLTQ